MYKKKILIISLALMLLLSSVLMSACGGASNDGAGSTLTYGSGDYTAINPALFEHGEINLLLFAGLTAHNEKNEVIPGLAESYEWDGDSNTYSFKLREGLTFHDGEPLTASDVKFTLDVILDEDNASEIYSNYEDITNINVVDDLNIEITLDEPNAAFLEYMTIGILPEHKFAGTDIAEDDFNTNPIGAGPFKLSEWDMGQSIVMDKFDDYYAGAPKLENVVFKIVEDDDQRALQLKSGDLDFAQITPKSSCEFKGDEDFKINVMKTADYRAIMYNFGNDFWKDNKELIRAFSYAIDREAIIDSVLHGYGQVAYSPLQEGDYYNKEINRYTYNPDMAKKLIEGEGWKMGDNGFYEKDGKELGFVINNGQGDQVRIDMSNIAAQNLQDIGVNATVEVQAEVDWENQDSYLIGWGSPFDPDDHTYKIFGTDQGANYSGYSNKKVDELLTEGRQHVDSDERLPYYQDFQEELAKDPAYTFIAYIDAIYAGKSNITGIAEDTVLGHHGVGIFWNIHEWSLN